jgi:predicted RNA-binding protein with PUA-like domain
MNYWLMKSEPDVFGIDDLAKAKNGTSAWDGVRNFQARNFLRDEMEVGDLAFFYHSSCEIPGIVGIMKIVREGYPDETQFDPKNDHFDPASKREAPRWYVVDVKFEKKFARIVSLDELRKHSTGKLKDMIVLKRGNRLSITPVTKSEWDFINSLV